jgi:tetratricopeptide (TPR) repeat protein
MMKRVALIILALSLVLTGCASNTKNGVELLEAQKYEEAKEVFQKDIDKKKRLDEAYRGLGIACFELKEYEEAAKAFEAALKNEAEETASICAFLGACYMELEDYNKALDIYKKALTKENISKELKQEVQFNLIAVYEKLVDWEAAKKQVELYVKEYPEDTRVNKEADFLETR